MDEARLKAKVERLNRVPGPGAYDVKKTLTTGQEVRM